MKVAVFSTKYYEREYLDKANTGSSHHLSYFDVPLNVSTAEMAKGCDVVCILVSDTVNREVIEKIAGNMPWGRIQQPLCTVGRITN